MKSAWMLCVLMSLLISCDPGVEIDNIPSDKLLFVSSRISPRDSSLTVSVFRALGLSERVPFDSLIETNARVIISDGSREAALQYYAHKRQYECLNIFKDATAGTHFTLSVTTSDGIKVVGHSVLPPKPKLVSFKSSYHDNMLKYSLVWKNQEGHKYFQAWNSLEGPMEDLQGGTWFLKSSANLALEPEIYFWDRQPTGINNLTDSIRIIYKLAGPTKISFTLANMEESTWKYIKTSDKYQNWLSNAEESSIIPIFREPAQVYSNIEGGFGVFSSFNCTDSLRLTINPGD